MWTGLFAFNVVQSGIKPLRSAEKGWVRYAATVCLVSGPSPEERPSMGGHTGQGEVSMAFLLATRSSSWANPEAVNGRNGPPSGGHAEQCTPPMFQAGCHAGVRGFTKNSYLALGFAGPRPFPTFSPSKCGWGRRFQGSFGGVGKKLGPVRIACELTGGRIASTAWTWEAEPATQEAPEILVLGLAGSRISGSAYQWRGQRHCRQQRMARSTALYASSYTRNVPASASHYTTLHSAFCTICSRNHRTVPFFSSLSRYRLHTYLFPSLSAGPLQHSSPPSPRAPGSHSRSAIVKRIA